MELEVYKKIKLLTENTIEFWKNNNIVIDVDGRRILDKSMLEWMIDLTNTLSIWINKGEKMSDGELILARVNMGSLIESWLKFFCCIYYNDYKDDPIMKKKQIIEIDNDYLNFGAINSFLIGKVWEDVSDKNYVFVEKIRKMRNAIHSFNKTDIGTATEFLNDLPLYYDLIKELCDRLPDEN